MLSDPCDPGTFPGPLLLVSLWSRVGRVQDRPRGGTLLPHPCDAVVIIRRSPGLGGRGCVSSEEQPASGAVRGRLVIRF